MQMISALNAVQTHVLQKRNVVEDDLQRELVVNEVQEKARQFHIDRQKLDDWATECRRYQFPRCVQISICVVRQSYR